MKPRTPVHIWNLAVLEFNEKVWVEGTLLQGDRQRTELASTWLGHFKEVFLSYFKKPAAGVALNILTDTGEQPVHTNEKGRFYCLADCFQAASLQIFQEDRQLLPPEGYPYFFGKESSELEVISDLDDTVLHSHTASLFKRMYSILFILPEKRKAVAYTYQLMAWFKEQEIRVTYLSKSEANLFELIAAFINSKELPRGGLLLSPFLRYHQLPKPNKGKDYKYNHLKTMITQQPGSEVILLGDDTQRDMEIYTSIIRDYPGRIIKVFIRKSSITQSDRQRELWKELKDTGVSAVYFSDGDDAEKEIDHLAKLVK